MGLPRRRLPSDPKLSCGSGELDDPWTEVSWSGSEKLVVSLLEEKLWSELYSDLGIPSDKPGPAMTFEGSHQTLIETGQYA